MTSRPEFSPLPPDAPTEDRIGTALLAMGSAASAALVWFAVLTFIQTHLVAGSTAQSVAQVDPRAGYVNFLVYGTVAGLGFTGILAWQLLSPIPSTYRRGALSMVTALGGTSFSMIATLVLYQLWGRAALVLLAVVAVALAIFLARRAAASAR